MTAIKDNFPGQGAAVGTFGDTWDLITPDDNADLPYLYKAIVCGTTGGAVVCLDKAGTVGTFIAIAGLPLYGVRPTRIKSTGTVATPLYGLR